MRHRHYGTPGKEGWRGGGEPPVCPEGAVRAEVGARAPEIRRHAREGGVVVV